MPTMNFTSPAGTEASAAHPLDTLVQEHRAILEVLEAVEKESTAFAENRPLRMEVLRNAIDHCDDFEERLHHRKEEALFRALEEAGLDPVAGPTAVLRAEHAKNARWRDRLRKAMEANDRLRMQAAISGFIDEQRQHILKENQIVFPLARKLLSEDAFRALRRAFASADAGYASEQGTSGPAVTSRAL